MRSAAVVVLAGLCATSLAAEEWAVEPAAGPAALREVVEQAADGDIVRVEAGRYEGPIRVTRRLHLIGEGWPVIDGGNVGTVVELTAAGAVMEGFVVRGSGASLDQENSGIAVTAPNVEVRRNRLDDVLFGIYLRKASGSTLSDNRVRGKALDLPRRGDAIRVWYSDEVRLEANQVEGSRDVVLWYSNDLEIHDNRVVDGRYGLHFMYCDDARIEGNLLADNSVGAFLMYSRRLRLRTNTISGNHGPSGYGVGLKDMDDAVVSGNYLVGNRVGIFLDNSPRETGSTSSIEGNLLVANDFGILLLPNVRRAQFTGNGMVENQEQVGIAGAGGDPESNTWLGNYWSDYAGFDADGDRVGDVPYRAERLFESLTGRKPNLRLFHYSPASEALDFASRAFPLVRPQPKLIDPAPRLDRPALADVPALPSTGGGWGIPAALGMLALAGVMLVGTGRIGRRRAAPTGPRAGQIGDRAMIEVEGISKRFGRQTALDAVSFRVAAGESVALWGPNGAGKTTAIRALLGVIEVDGRVAIDGVDPATDGREARRRIGFIPQEIPLQGNLTTEETLEFYSRLRRCRPDRADELLSQLELEAHAGKKVRHLSGGLRQRLALAIALLADPPILLLDEPSANLDDASRRAFLQVLAGLKGSKTIVFSTHRRSEVLGLADRVLMLDAGRLVDDGDPVDLLSGGDPEAGVLRLAAERRRFREGGEHGAP
ncbi:MAG: nitrous oxide reductase family maturation protein NosD [Thermoanaerobaculia bacterium]|nr:nitrous oxide reductase family maturation protein NosD [Thermoanaerobaculia bacterium]